MLWSKPKPKIEFYCRPEDRDVIAEPRPAKSDLPTWFRKLPAIDKDHLTSQSSGLTVKRCMPFLDALALGWVIPLAATVRLDIRDGGRTVEAGWEFDRVMVSNHGAHQAVGHPHDPRPPCKFHNHWTIRTAPGWSCLFLPPLNRPNPVFEVVAGVVDTDRYASLIHFPFYATGSDGVHILEKGTPVVQVIPFRRSDVEMEAVIRPESAEEGERREKIYRQTLAEDGWYRKNARATR